MPREPESRAQEKGAPRSLGAPFPIPLAPDPHPTETIISTLSIKLASLEALVAAGIMPLVVELRARIDCPENGTASSRLDRPSSKF